MATAKTVKMATIVNMSRELNEFKEKLVIALTSGKDLPEINSDMILKKYIKVATDELKLTMPLRTARKLATNVLTPIMLGIIEGQ